MYSPKISEEHIPVLYKLAKQQKIPMTKLVNDIINNALTQSGFVKETTTKYGITRTTWIGVV